MSDMNMASAIAVPEPVEELAADTNGLKRRQSEISEQNHEEQQQQKRQRTSPGKKSPTEAPAATTRDSSDARPNSKDRAGEGQEKEGQGDSRAPHRKRNVADEKQRSRRLFGALLGSLNQPSDRTSKRRQEIESRRKAELQRQDDELVEDKNRMRERLAEQRRRAQVRVDEENMRTRHANMLDRANYLQTTSEPKLFYRPWELRPDEEDRIEEQVKEAQSQIDRELEQLTSHPKPSEARRDSNNPALTHSPAAASEPKVERLDEKAAEEPAKSSAATNNQDSSRPAEVPESSDHTYSDTDVVAPSSNSRSGSKGEGDQLEDADDHVVEGDEDTVIY